MINTSKTAKIIKGDITHYTLTKCQCAVNNAKFGAISDNFRFRSRITPERYKISKIEKQLMISDSSRVPLKKYVELWPSHYRELYVSLNPPKLHFSREHIYGVLAPQILTRTRDSPILVSTHPYRGRGSPKKFKGIVLGEGPPPKSWEGKIHRRFKQLSTLIANISRMDRPVENQKRSWSTTTLPTLGKKRFLLRSTKKNGELWSTNYRELDVSLDPPKLHFWETISALRGCWPLKF